MKGAEPGDRRKSNTPSSELMKKRMAFALSDASGDPDEAELMGQEELAAGFRSKIGVPVVFNAELVGEIDVKSEVPDLYTSQDLDLLERVAELIAGAIANARLHAVATSRAMEEQQLAAIGRLVTASLDFNDVFGELAEYLKQMIPFDRFAIMGLNPESRTLVTHFVSGVEVEGWEAGTSHAISDWQQGTQLLPTEGLLIDSTPEMGENEVAVVEAGLASNASVPLLWEGRAVGALSVRVKEAGLLTSHHLELLGRVGLQITGAFVNAELHAVTQQDAAERTALAEIGRLINSSLDVEQMFTAIARPFKDLVPYNRFVATTWDVDTGMWTTRFVAGDRIEGHEPGVSRIDNSPAALRMIADMTSTISTGSDEPIDESADEEYETPRLRSAVRVPLMVNGELIGSIAARSREKNAYDERHLELAQRIGSQIAGSVANSELHRVLSDNEARTRAVVETATVGIITTDSKLAIETVNDAVLSIFGYTREELIGKNVMILASRQYRNRETSYLNQYFRSGMAGLVGSYPELEGVRKDGSVFPVELEIAKVELEEGVMYTAIVRDITDRKLAESDLAELTASLEQRVVDRTSELEAFSYSVSHDLRGPLAMNAHLAERLLQSDQGALPETAKKYIELIARSSQESADLVTDLLNFSRLGKQEMTVRPIEPSEIVESIKTDFEELNPEVNWTVGEMPACEADPGLLRVVFTNLMSNACKFTDPDREPLIEIGAIKVDGESAYFVRDNGVGFDMSEADKVFEVFERLHRPEDYPGTGAGLAIVQRIIDRHGGRVWTESAVGEGSTFFFTIP